MIDKNIILDIANTIESNKINEVLVAPNLLELINYLRSKKIVCLNEANSQRPSLRDNISCIVDFSEILKHESSTNLTFENLIKRKHHHQETLSTLNLANSILNKDGSVTIFCPKQYNVSIVKKYLLCAKFINVQFNNNVITAKKREFVKYTFDRVKMTFEETNSPDIIEHIQYFAKGLFKNNNFDLSIDDLFVQNSDFFVCYRTNTKEIVSFLRFTWYLPNYPLPCMLATIEGTETHIILEDPDSNNYGEVFSPLITTISSVKAYKEIGKAFYAHCLHNDITYLFTTFNRDEPETGEFFKKTFGFADTGTTLKYGNFGGRWGLLKGDKTGMIPQIENLFKMKKQ